MKLTNVLKPDCIKVPLAARDKTQAIVELVGLLDKAGAIRDRDAVLQSVLEREARRSTGIGHGLAIPHGKSNACDELVMAIGKPAEPIDFESIDGQPAQIIVLLASPVDQTGPHIQALARISRIMTIESVRSDMFRAESADELYRIIASHES
jgi:fructose-specific phosphotransferase system IIA component